MNEEDRLPKVMCGECTDKLNLLSDFREKAYKTETALLTMADLVKVKDEANNLYCIYTIIKLPLHNTAIKNCLVLQHCTVLHFMLTYFQGEPLPLQIVGIHNKLLTNNLAKYIFKIFFVVTLKMKPKKFSF